MAGDLRWILPDLIEDHTPLRYHESSFWDSDRRIGLEPPSGPDMVSPRNLELDEEERCYAGNASSTCTISIDHVYGGAAVCTHALPLGEASHHSSLRLNCAGRSTTSTEHVVGATWATTTSRGNCPWHKDYTLLCTARTQIQNCTLLNSARDQSSKSSAAVWFAGL